MARRIFWSLLSRQNAQNMQSPCENDGVQGGYIDNAPPGRKNLGSRILFRESLELGYQVNPVVSVSAILDHISNANLAPHNAGITSAGARIGFRF